MMFEGFLGHTESVTVAHLGGNPPGALVLHGPVRDRSARLFPTDALQKGLVLRHGEKDVCGEGMGFALPVLAHPSRAVFPGRVSLELGTEQRKASDVVSLTARYDLCMVQSLLLGGTRPIKSARFYRLREWLSQPNRGSSKARAFREWGAQVLTAIGRARLDYVERDSVGSATVKMTVRPGAGRVEVEVDPTDLLLPGATLSVLNELDGRLFDCYGDSRGTELYGDAIGIWDKVDADQVWLRAPSLGMGFGISAVSDAELYRGRETYRPSLAWSGLACVTDKIGPGAPPVKYVIEVSRDE